MKGEAVDDLNGHDLDEGGLSEFEDMASMPLGGDEFPRPVDWSTLSVAERRSELRRLWPWVAEFVRTWPVSRDVVPPCWYRHESLVRVLSALRDAYLTAYHATQAASAAADWMQVWDATEERLRRWVARAGCKSQHHPDRIQRWVTEPSDVAATTREFEAFVDADYDQRSADQFHDTIAT